MLDDPIKGYLIARFPGRWENDKRKDLLFKIYPFFGFFTIPVIILAVLMSPESARDIAMFILIPMVLIMSVSSFFIFQMTLMRQRAPIIVYSGGIEYKGGYLDRWRHRPDFIPKSMVQKVDVSESTVDTVKGKETYVSINIRLINGQMKQTFRKAEIMGGFKESMGKMGAVVSENKTATFRPLSSPSTPSTPTETAWSGNGNNFCGGCGTRLPEGSTFCSKCGRKV